ncbi:hypothetical protein BZG36_03232 [Bifiguratus adelaidae]|uniref:Septum formation protein Maf n=1 Tax=Bifiguratus adelaidae TaxID=1938954 RepID=A0A261XWX1_9FUNG|nr:hypothetical protein BZG36_03232 [Bifiguratus adelaidae]
MSSQPRPTLLPLPVIHLPFLERLKTKHIILASGSPRRKNIIESLGLQISIQPSRFAENLSKDAFATPQEYVAATAKAKAQDVYDTIKKSRAVAPDLVIGADTIVVLDGTILEKPHTAKVAKTMLSDLSGRSHQVFTALSFLCKRQDGVTRSHEVVEETIVNFNAISDADLDAYIATGEPLDKAGGYGYQGLASFFITSINGDYWNVVGFPTCRFYNELLALIKQGEL